MTTHAPILPTLGFLILTGCAQLPAPHNRAEEAQALRHGEVAAFTKDWSGKDADRIAAHFTGDSNVMVPNSPTMQPVQVDVSTSGDLGYARGTYVLTATDPATRKAATEKGRFLTIFRKQLDGSWKAIEHINNAEARGRASRPPGMRPPLLLQLCFLTLSGAITAPSATLRATVIEDHSGHAVVSVELRIARRGVTQLVADLESDGNGRFEPVDLDEGEYLLTVSKSNYLETTLRLKTASLPNPLELRLVRCGSVSGRVSDPTGGPIANAYVFALSGSNRLDTVTRADGEYRIFGLTPGEYTIAVAYGQPTLAVGKTGNPPPLGPAGAGAAFYPEKLTVLSGDEHLHIDFALTTAPLFHVSGSVDAPDSPDGDFWVALAPAANPEIATSVAIAGTDGSFRLEGIRPGSYDVFVSGPSNSRSGYGAHLGEHPLFGRTQVEVTAQNVDDLRLKVAPALTLPVLVRAGEGCSPKAQVSVRAMEDWGAYLTLDGKSGEDGKVVLPHAAPARYRVSAISDTCFQAKDVVADLTGGSAKPVEVNLIRGASLQVHVDPPAPLVLLGAAGTKTEMPDAGGKLEFSGLPPGRYRLKALAGTRKNIPDLDLQAGEVRKLELDLRKPEGK